MTSRGLRVLFLHATRQHTSEYNVHQLLAENADPNWVDCFFIWQTHKQDAAKNKAARLSRENRNFYYDFGRDMSLKPKPAKWHRLFMMLYRFPFAFFFLSWKVWKIQPDIIYTSQQRYEVFLAKTLSFFQQFPELYIALLD